MTLDLYADNLRRLEILHSGISPVGKEVYKELLINNFMEKTFEIGILGNEKVNSEDFTVYINASQKIVMETRFWIEFYIKNIDRIMNHAFQADEWKEICRKRSAVQFVTDFYHDLRLDQNLISTLDDRIVAIGVKEGGLPTEDIPKHIPDAHYWWFI